MDVDYSRLREGLCPIHGTLLDRREDCGWCEDCSMGWSMTPDTITAHVEATARTLDGEDIGPGTVWLTRRQP